MLQFINPSTSTIAEKRGSDYTHLHLIAYRKFISWTWTVSKLDKT